MAASPARSEGEVLKTLRKIEVNGSSVERSRSGVTEGLKNSEKSRGVPSKVHRSAICVIPPEEVWGPIQEIRRVHDKHYKRWMPHINLIYPFHVDEGDNFQVAAETAVAKLSSLQPFQLSLKSFSYFQHNRSCTMWLDPTDATPKLQTLQAALQEVFPECKEQGTISDSFKPHLSVGQWRNKRETEASMQELEASWEGLEFTLKEVYLISRADFHDPFRKRYAIPLGAEPGTEPRLLWTPPPLKNDSGASNGSVRRSADVRAKAAPEEKSDTSTSGEADLIWNFAYGANVNKHKLEVVRRILPKDSVPGRLADYRLAFNHRGAMGNVVEAPGEALHGLLHQVTREDFNRLREMESGYSPVEVDVEAYDGRGSVRAIVFCSRPEEMITDGLPPSARYLNLIRSGAKEWGLHPNYVAWLDSLPSIDARSRGAQYYQSPDGTKLPGTANGRQRGGRQSGRGRPRGGRSSENSNGRSSRNSSARETQGFQQATMGSS